MSKEDRIKLIEDIEKLRKSKVISYFLGTKSNMATQMGPDAIREIYRHLLLIGKCENIDLFLYTSGGEVHVPYRITKLIREFCKKFSVLVPYRAYSAGTLLCMGADEIVMGTFGELTPIDPTTSNPFNPKDPRDPNKVIPISVEDVTSYISLAKEKAGLKGEDKVLEIFKLLADKDRIHPLALGNVHRILKQIRNLARLQLSQHMDEKESERIRRIIENLTERYPHGHLMSRDDVKKIELDVTFASKKMESLMWKLYELYENDIKIWEPFDPEVILQQHKSKQKTTPPQQFKIQLPKDISPEIAQQMQQQIAQQITPPIKVEFSNVGAFIESIKRTDAYIFKGTVAEIRTPQGMRDIIVNMKPRWEEVRGEE